MNFSEAQAVAGKLKSDDPRLEVEAYIPVGNDLNNARLRIQVGGLCVDHLQAEHADWHSYHIFTIAIQHARLLGRQEGKAIAVEQISNHLEAIVRSL